MADRGLVTEQDGRNEANRSLIAARYRLALRVHGPLDGTLITVMLFFYRRRMYRTGYVFQAASNRLENFWFQRRLRQFGFGRDE